MTTGYTQDQLDQLWREMEEHIPTIPTRADKRDAPAIVALTAAGTEFGILFNFGFDSDRSQFMFFNCHQQPPASYCSASPECLIFPASREVR